MVNIEPIAEIKNKLGEGPVWDEPSQCLYWVDSLQGSIFRLDVTGAVKQWDLPGMIGSLAITKSGRAVVALQNGLHFFDFETGDLSQLVDPEADIPETRFNDGKTDRQGNFVVGSMGIKIRDRALANLYRLDASLELAILEADVIVANGPCFSPEGDVFYFNDGRRRILAYDYDSKGPLTHKRVLFDGAEHETGSDGSTVDRDGNLWVALTGSSEVGCIDPSGRLLERIAMPMRLPSSVMFGGRELDELFVTSISNSGNRTSSEPQAGGLYKVTGIGATGLAERRFED